MEKLFVRIKRFYILTCNTFKNDMSFSLKLAIFRFLDTIGWRLGFKRISNWAHLKEETFILTYLKKELNDVILKYKDNKEIGNCGKNAPIWVCWWSGEYDAPLLVKQCIASIRKNAGNHPVHLIDQNNYSKYLQIPDFILKKIDTGSMCIANFTDYLRVSLVAKYGGLWLDSTIFCSEVIPEEYFNMPFFTCKSNPKESRYISKYRWTSFCLGGWKKNVFFEFFRDAWEQYWKSEDSSIDYLLVDYLIEIAITELDAVEKCFNQIPCNNPHRDDLQKAMNDSLPFYEFNKIINKDTCFYKLSWRESYSETAFNGEQSIYGEFIKKSN